jgi:multimeric flavodoxin WrbA
MMKVVAFNGSARKNGNTAILVRAVFEEIEKAGIETELIQLAGKPLHGCRACGKCWRDKNARCAQNDDELNDYLQQMISADGIILASPTYFADVTAEMKALIDRVGSVSKANRDLLKRKVGAAVIAVRRGGQIHAFDTINHLFLISQMVIPGSIYWNFGFGLNKGEVEQDKEGMKIMKALGENMAWVLKRLFGTSA